MDILKTIRKKLEKKEAFILIFTGNRGEILVIIPSSLI